MSRKLPALMALSAAVSLALAGCSGTTDSASTSAASDAASASASQASSVTIADNHGSVEVALPVQRAASTDNRTFEVLADWGVPLVAAPKQLIPSSITAYDATKSPTSALTGNPTWRRWRRPHPTW
nr:hypothetical protein [Actinomyces ruminis]